jgi:hypothetical protein
MKIVSLPELMSFPGTNGGLRVSSSQIVDNLVVNGALEDSAVGYSANVPFATEAPLAKPVVSHVTIAELGLMTGAADPMMMFPAGTTFTPYSLLRNVSDSPISLTPTFWWMEGGAPRSAKLPQVSLLPHETKGLDLVSLLSEAGLKNFHGSLNLVFEGDILPGSLLLASGSVDQTNSYVFEVVPRGIAEGASKSFQQWSTANGDDTMFTIWNPADEPQDFVFTLFFAAGSYALPIHLEARATRSFNVSELVQSQIPDAKGSLIPAGIHEGTATLAGSLGENQHILVAADSGIYNVRKATCTNNCQTCNGYSAAALIDGLFTVATNGTHQQNFYLTYGSGTQYNFTGSSTWSSNNTPVASVASGLVHGVSPGSATISAFTSSQPVQAGYICLGPGSCPTSGFSGNSGGTSVNVTISRQSSSSSTAASDNSARDAYKSNVGTYNLGAFVATGGFCSVGYQATGAVAPSSYTGSINLVRTKSGVGYTGSTGQTVDHTYPTGTGDTSPPQFEDKDPQSGGSNGKVYDLDAPGVAPAVSQVGRIRYNFFENAQLPDGTYVANEVGFYVRVSCNWGSAGNSFRNEISGDNTLGLGTTKTSWNLQ